MHVCWLSPQGFPSRIAILFYSDLRDEGDRTIAARVNVARVARVPRPASVLVFVESLVLRVRVITSGLRRLLVCGRPIHGSRLC